MRQWISIGKELPKHNQTVEYASHQTYGLAIFDENKGFTKVFWTYGPWEAAEYLENHEVINHEIMYWRKIPEWPCYGCRGIDSPLMQKFYE